MFGIAKSNGHMSHFMFIISHIESELETNTSMDNITKRRLETELQLLKQLNTDCDIEEYGKTLEEVKNDLDNSVFIILSQKEYEEYIKFKRVKPKLKELTDILNYISL